MPNNDYILRSDALKAILGVSIYDTIEELEGTRTIAENTWADGLYDAYKIIEEEVDAVDVEPRKRWIPVTEELPEIGKKVLVLAYRNEVLTARLKKQTENGFPVFECNGIFLEMAKPGRITHWMPLPEPPKEETVNEITPEMIEAAERNEKRIKERADRIYDELIAEKRAEIERLEAEIAKMPPFDAEKLAANPPVPPKETKDNGANMAL